MLAPREETTPTARDNRCWHFTVPWDVSRTGKNQLRRLAHWSQVSSRVEAARLLARRAWIEAGEPKASGKVSVSFTVRRGRRIDDGSVLSGVQPVIDGIFVDAMTKNDGSAWLCFGEVRQETGARWKGREEVELLVEEIGAYCRATSSTEAAPAVLKTVEENAWQNERAARLEAVYQAAAALDRYPVDLRGWNKLRAAVKNVEAA